MQNIKYHISNIIAVILFSYTLAITVNQFFRFSIDPTDSSSIKNKKSFSTEIKKTSFPGDYSIILDSGFFQIASIATETTDSDVPIPVASNLTDFQLLGTISGPASIARALIKKKGEKNPEIFKLWTDVYGYKLVRIDNSKAYLKSGDQVEILDMYAKIDNKKGFSKKSSSSSRSNGSRSKNISRSEIQQKVLNNMDNALKGIRAGPYRVNGKIEGYKLFRVRPNNILYQFGARSGDIVKRINGHPVDSTEKLMKMWGSLQGEGKITVDIERGGKLQTFDFNITE